MNKAIEVKSINEQIAALRGAQADYEHDIDAVGKALEGSDVTLRLDYGVPETAHVYPEWRDHYPQPAPWFSFGDGDMWAEQRRHGSMAEYAAIALLMYLQWEASFSTGN